MARPDFVRVQIAVYADAYKKGALDALDALALAVELSGEEATPARIRELGPIVSAAIDRQAPFRG